MRRDGGGITRCITGRLCGKCLRGAEATSHPRQWRMRCRTLPFDAAQQGDESRVELKMGVLGGTGRDDSLSGGEAGGLIHLPNDSYDTCLRYVAPGTRRMEAHTCQ
jgi:hypothetical protein